jgi:hypothetical protein
MLKFGVGRRTALRDISRKPRGIGESSGRLIGLTAPDLPDTGDSSVAQDLLFNETSSTPS